MDGLSPSSNGAHRDVELALARALMSWISHSRLETFATVLLSLGALATSWTGYQSTLWNSTQSQTSTRASRYYLCALEASTAAGQMRAVDISVFMEWLSARADSKPKLARFYEERFRSEFMPAFKAWAASARDGEPPASTPFASANYNLALDERSRACRRKAFAATLASQDANRTGERYVMGTVAFAIVLFFAGTTNGVKANRTRAILLGVATAALILGLISMLSLPVSRPLKTHDEAIDSTALLLVPAR